MDLNFVVLKDFGPLEADRKGWPKHLKLISWNGSPPVFDIRPWDLTHTKCGKGLTLNEDEFFLLYTLLDDLTENMDEVKKLIKNFRPEPNGKSQPYQPKTKTTTSNTKGFNPIELDL